MPPESATLVAVDTEAGKPSRPRELRAGLLTIAVASAGVINFAYSLLMTHLLPKGEYSTFAAGQSVLLVAGTLAVAAVPWVLAQELVRADGNPRRQGAAVRFALRGNVLGGLVIALITGGFSTSFASWPIPGLIALGTFLLVVGSTGTGFLQGTQRMGALAGIALTEFSAKAIFGVVAVGLFGAGVPGALGATSVGAALLTLGGFFFMRSTLGRGRAQAPSPGLWVSAARIGAIQVMVALISAADTVVVAMLASTKADAASYQAASTLGRVPLSLSVALSIAVFPLIVARRNDRNARVDALRAYLAVSLFIVIALATVPGSLLGSLFPSGYAGLRDLLPYTAALGAAVGLLNLLTTFVQAQARVRSCLVLLIIGFFVHCFAMYAGAKADGVTGLAIGGCCAAWATVAAVALLPSERPATFAIFQRMRPSAVVALTCLVLPPLLLRTPLLWLAWAVAAGAAVIVQAFPGIRRSLPGLAPLVTWCRSRSTVRQ